MKDLQFLIYDVRDQTDNVSENGIKDREFVRYFNDGIKTIQAMIFKNNPLCSYYQSSIIYSALNTSRIYDLPDDVFGDNAVSLVEVTTDGGTHWTPLDRVWPEEGGSFVGWYTRNKQLFMTGPENYRFYGQVRVWYFKRLPRFDKVWATVDGAPVGNVITLDLLDANSEIFRIDRNMTFLDPSDFSVKGTFAFKKLTDTTIQVTSGDISTLLSGDLLLMGKNSTYELEMPEECEPYLMDYVAQRISGRQAYGDDWNRMNFWTSEERSNIMSIFADASQTEVRAPITDTEYMRI